MALKKTIAAKITNGKVVSPQQDIDMHPLEEKKTLAYWAVNDYLKTMPLDITKEEEHEILVNSGADEVKKKRAEVLAIRAKMQPELDALIVTLNKHTRDWNAHCDMCEKNGLDKNKF